MKPFYFFFCMIFFCTEPIFSQNIISVQPNTQNEVFCLNGTTRTLSVVTNAGLLAANTSFSYQWFKNSTASRAGATLIVGATQSTYTIPSNVLGVFYFYCQVVLTQALYDGKVWTGYNLDVVTYNNGDPIRLVTDPAAWSNLTTGAYCYPNNDINQVPVYGLLYNWYAVTDPRGIAPLGFHLPTKDEFSASTSYLTNINCGFRDRSGSYFKRYGYLWSTTKDWTYTNNTTMAFLRLFYEDGPITVIDDARVGISVRCIKNQ